VIWPLLRTRRWLGFTAVVIGTIIAFGLLSHWQWSRADEHRRERLALQAAIASAPVDVSTLGADELASDEWRAVTVEGRYLPELQAAVRKRPLNAQNGFWLMSAIQQDSGPVVWVNRGWMPAGENALATPDFPVPPSGDVTVTGYLRAFEPAEPDANDGLPEHQIAAPALPLLPTATDPLPAYVQLATSTPPQDGLVVLPVATVDEGQNISYAVQWLLFAAVAIGGWFFFLRREAIEDAARRAQSAPVPEHEEA
jgi:cytochrome oxidase assembly protein ShyY1